MSRGRAVPAMPEMVVSHGLSSEFAPRPGDLVVWSRYPTSTACAGQFAFIVRNDDKGLHMTFLAMDDGTKASTREIWRAGDMLRSQGLGDLLSYLEGLNPYGFDFYAMEVFSQWLGGLPHAAA